MKKIKWIMLALVLCLGLVGGAYAAWSDTAEIRGSVATGDIDVRFVANSGSYTDGVFTANWATSTDRKRLTVTIANAYPGTDWTLGYTVNNEGTLPVKVDSVHVFNAANPSNSYVVNPVGNKGGTGLQIVHIPVTDPEIAAGGSLGGDMEFWVDANAKQNETYTYELDIDFLLKTASISDADLR